jgi:hypothetical protein
VRSAGAEGVWGNWSSYATFRAPPVTSAGLAPVAPALHSIVDYFGGRVLQWQHPVPEVFYWEIQLSTDPSFNTDAATATSAVWWNLVDGGMTVPRHSWKTPPLVPETVYHWRVRPRAQGGAQPVEWGPTWSFITAPGH